MKYSIGQKLTNWSSRLKAKSETFFKRVFDYKTFDKTVYKLFKIGCFFAKH